MSPVRNRLEMQRRKEGRKELVGEVKDARREIVMSCTICLLGRGGLQVTANDGAKIQTGINCCLCVWVGSNEFVLRKEVIRRIGEC